jgi:hypothetical protein
MPFLKARDMTPEMQLVFNIVAGVAGLFGSFILTRLWGALDDMRKDHAALARKQAETEVLVAGAYAKREDVERLGQAIFTKLDNIENKLDRKADKP